MNNKFNLISIDPSITKLGIALWDINHKLRVATLISQPTKGRNWYERATVMADAVIYFVEGVICTIKDGWNYPWVVVSETPENWFSSKGAAAKDSEAIQKLYFYVGAQTQAFKSQLFIHSIYLANPGTWKGQTPKELMVQRAQHHYPHEQKITDHNICEAILLGKYAYHQGAGYEGSPFLRFQKSGVERVFIDERREGAVPQETRDTGEWLSSMSVRYKTYTWGGAC